jgi:hypothetical protein
MGEEHEKVGGRVIDICGCASRMIDPDDQEEL